MSVVFIIFPYLTGFGFVWEGAASASGRRAGCAYMCGSAFGRI
ncbi:hypothetical protein NMH_0170 [Neisseria meningitidis H44/76]|uniref:Uncharacterized protein n=3 Tax=Neisseria meningitidis TaxID=487 RepID=A0A0H5DM31_NEIMI|nr:hypothetical protein HMPREF0602_1890 [Neisseria meningitidis ATCC 13091]EFV64571.1 hypothetical protein NMH_0170 [Neisseria meningitidis H44/76]CRL92296.1 hypothetical protein [Neisseria meningitidis serogroup B]